MDLNLDGIMINPVTTGFFTERPADVWGAIVHDQMMPQSD